MMALRFTEEQLQEFYRRAKQRGDVRQHVIADDSRHATVRVKPEESKLERRMSQQIEDAKLPVPRRNHFPILGRDFELDFSWPDRKLAVEVQGMPHRIKGKFKADIEKRALCLLAGWKVLEVDGASIKDGRAIEWLKELLS